MIAKTHPIGGVVGVSMTPVAGVCSDSVCSVTTACSDSLVATDAASLGNPHRGGVVLAYPPSAPYAPLITREGGETNDRDPNAA